jgi:wyosine [tRNA(Phe)-imidazoG37] synthetase (radical SAM superfamily)
MIDSAGPYPQATVIYHRSADYDEISPTIPRSRRQALSHVPEVNLCDYWDYLAGMADEAVEAARANRTPPLRRLSVFITELCNLRCSYCRRSPATAQAIDLEWLLVNLPKARSMGAIFVDVMGLGEPTLVDELPDLLQAASSLGLVGTVGTNGATSNLADESYLSRLFDASPLKFRVSLDSADPDEHNRLRGNRATWHRAVGFIETVARAREEGRLQAGLFVNRVVRAATLETIPRDLKFFAELGVDDVHLIPIRFESEQFCSVEQIHRFNAEIAPQVREIGAQCRLAWARENAYIFGRSPEEIERAACGLYYQPTLAEKCYVLKAQIVLDPRLQPFTCLWGKRAGGKPVWKAPDPAEDLEELREHLLNVQYLDVNPQICRDHCTKEVIKANNRVHRLLRLQVGDGSG